MLNGRFVSAPRIADNRAAVVSTMPVFPLYCLTVDLTRCGPGELGDKYHVFGFLKTRNSLANELDEIRRAYAFSRLACAYRLDAFAPLRVDDADHHDLGNRRMFENRAFDFGRINVFTTGFDQVLGRRTSRVP